MTDHFDMELPSEGLSELLGAYVLDAVDDVERRRVERAASTDPAIAREIEELRAGLSVLDDSFEVDPPANMWDSIQAKISSGDGVEPKSSNVQGITQIDSGGPAHSAFRRPLMAAAAIVGVVVISGALIVGLTRSSKPTDSIAAMTAMANDAATKPGSRQGVLTDPEKSMEVRVIVDPRGQGFVMTDPLPALPEGETYQLWSAANGTMVSLGMLGSNPQMSLVPIDASVTELALTKEPAQGSVVPTSAPMATGTLV